MATSRGAKLDADVRGEALGHARVATTNVCLARVAGHEVVEIMRGREWHLA